MENPYESDREVDELQQAMKAGRRKKILIGAAVILLPIGYWAMGFSAVEEHLKSSFYTDIEVTAAGTPVEYRFKGKKGVGTSCRGTVSRFPFSMSVKSSCTQTVDVNGNPMEPPTRR